MSVLSTHMPVKSSHIRAIEVITEYLELSQRQREREAKQFMEAHNARTMPVEISFKAAITNLKA